ncbi:MAG: geranylgeranyl reductase family protein [Chitinophagaceae bacterium]
MTEPKTHYPVVIIGAGPAGCATSTYLSKARIEHIILDKSSFPRDKVCGDAMSGKTTYVIKNADERWMKELMESPSVLPSGGLCFVAPNGKSLAIPFGKKPDGYAPGFTATRLFFDNFLFKRLDKKFAKVLSPATLQSLEYAAGIWQLSIESEMGVESYSAKMLVAADGDKSIVRKKMGLQEASPKTSAVGLRAYYSGVTGMKDNQIELHFLPELIPGYFWIFPLTNGRANIGAGMLSADVRFKKINLREKMLEAIAKNPNLKERFAYAKLEGKILGWGLPMGMEKKPISGDGYLLTGDAAQLIDPFSGEGIGNAMYSGMKAAQAIEAALAAHTFDKAFFAKAYDEPMYSRLWGELQTSTVLQRLCRFPWLFNFVINKANKSPTLKATITGMFTDLDLRSKLRQPSFYLKMIFNR